jgi:hypothetical protein
VSDSVTLHLVCERELPKILLAWHPKETQKLLRLSCHAFRMKNASVFDVQSSML